MTSSAGQIGYTDADGALTSTQYNRFGKQVKVTVSEIRTYDSADRITDPCNTYDAFGRIVAIPGGQTNAYSVNDLVAGQQTATDRMFWTLGPQLRFRATTAEVFVGGIWTNALTRVNHYGGDTDRPHWIAENTAEPAILTRNITSPEGDLALTAGKTTAALGIPNPSTPTAATNRYNWLGGEQRSSDALGDTILMGVHVSHPTTGRFHQADPIPGNSANAYGFADPVNKFDLAGKCAAWCWLCDTSSFLWKHRTTVQSVASFIPVVGPAFGTLAIVSAIWNTHFDIRNGAHVGAASTRLEYSLEDNLCVQATERLEHRDQPASTLRQADEFMATPGMKRARLRENHLGARNIRTAHAHSRRRHRVGCLSTGATAAYEGSAWWRGRHRLRFT